MTYYERLIAEAGPAPVSPLGSKPNNPFELSARAAEARRLTELFESNEQFSFLRLGDMDLGLLLAIQESVNQTQDVFSGTSNTGTQPCGDPGITKRHSKRLRNAFLNATYLDYYDRIWPNKILLKSLKLDRPSHVYRNTDASTSLIIYTWMEHEFKKYCEGRRVGFVGAEAGVLEVLHQSSVFLDAAIHYWPTSGKQFFHHPRDNGSNLDVNLDRIKTDLIDFVNINKIDTLFVSLGGAAKILCYELAKELNIRCIDFGAMLRGLCYLGSDGNRVGRSTHSPFFYRLPFDLVMDAIEKTFPQLNPHELLAKAHAQVILEYQKKEVGWTTANWEYDNGSESAKLFRQSEKRCCLRYWNRPYQKQPFRDEIKRFLHFSGTHQLTWRGRFFLWFFKAKSLLSKIIRRSN